MSDTQTEEREILIGLLERCLERILEDHESKYFSTLYGVCFPHASTFLVGKNPNATLRWLFRSASIDAHVQAIWIIANEER